MAAVAPGHTSVTLSVAGGSGALDGVGDGDAPGESVAVAVAVAVAVFVSDIDDVAVAVADAVALPVPLGAADDDARDALALLVELLVTLAVPARTLCVPVGDAPPSPLVVRVGEGADEAVTELEVASLAVAADALARTDTATETVNVDDFAAEPLTETDPLGEPLRRALTLPDVDRCALRETESEPLRDGDAVWERDLPGVAEPEVDFDSRLERDCEAEVDLVSGNERVGKVEELDDDNTLSLAVSVLVARLIAVSLAVADTVELPHLVGVGETVPLVDSEPLPERVPLRESDGVAVGLVDAIKRDSAGEADGEFDKEILATIDALVETLAEPVRLLVDDAVDELAAEALAESEPVPVSVNDGDADEDNEPRGLGVDETLVDVEREPECVGVELTHTDPLTEKDELGVIDGVRVPESVALPQAVCDVVPHVLLVGADDAVPVRLAELLAKEDPENVSDTDALIVAHDDGDVVGVEGIEGDPDPTAETESEPVCVPVNEARSVGDRVPVPHAVVELVTMMLADGTREMVAAAESDADIVGLSVPVATVVEDCVIDDVMLTENADECVPLEVEHAEWDGLGEKVDELHDEVEKESVCVGVMLGEELDEREPVAVSD